MDSPPYQKKKIGCWYDQHAPSRKSSINSLKILLEKITASGDGSFLLAPLYEYFLST